VPLTLSMRPHGSLDDGVKANDLDNEKIADQLKAKLGKKFEVAYVKIGPVNGWVAKSYHIKVAVRDHAAFWLSSGNWQTSNQPDIDPLDDKPQTRAALDIYNREWHAIVEHSDLAKTLETYLLNDFKNNETTAAEEAVVALASPLEIFVPEPAEVCSGTGKGLSVLCAV